MSDKVALLEAEIDGDHILMRSKAILRLTMQNKEKFLQPMTPRQEHFQKYT
jgi:hypothetical protein